MKTPGKTVEELEQSVAKPTTSVIREKAAEY